MPLDVSTRADAQEKNEVITSVRRSITAAAMSHISSPLRPLGHLAVDRHPALFDCLLGNPEILASSANSTASRARPRACAGCRAWAALPDCNAGIVAAS